MAINTQRCQAWAPLAQTAAILCQSLPLVAIMRAGLLANMLAFGQLAFGSTLERHPAVNLTPQQVVRIVVDSLKDNDAASDSGIATVFSFAAPANKLSTGPLSRFTTMIKRGFPDMLNHSSSRYEPMEIVGDIAIQAVWLMTPAGAELGYAFQLSRQIDGEYAGMWMTDRVIPLGKGSGSGMRI